MIITIIGLLAATLTTFSFVPQVLHTLRTNDTRGISLGMYSAFVIGIALWLIYGIVKNDLPIILANYITILLSGAILIMKLKNRKKDRDHRQYSEK
ncbi:SemiSWEET transporter [Roseivirga sp. BDSF3-8]|uniref:SemiSWEET transporter n=1 Tax=Roseivirga sp. BDSF3-8 TaxID=3241598 RepID=UPI0035323EE5